MDEKTVTSLFEEMKKDISSYVKSNLELAKLETYEKLSKAAANTAFSLVLTSLLLLCFIFMLITLGFYLADVLGSNWQGFGIVTLGAIVITLIFLFVKKPLKDFIINSVVKFLIRKEDEELTYKTKN